MSSSPFLQRWASRLFGEKTAPADNTPARVDEGEPAPFMLFDDWKFALTPGLRKRIKADAAQRLPEHAQPSAAQWKMIFSQAPATTVMAGAGSGKSTSLAMRLLVMHHYLGYSLDSITVITFTRESRKDFIKKMVQLFDLWEINISNGQAQGTVRTFHSRLLPQVHSLPGLADVRVFETLGAGTGNPFDLRINEAQRSLMNACYSELLNRDPDFRARIGALRLHTLRLKRLSPEHPEVKKRAVVTELAARRDEELCDLIEDHWYRAGVWPIEGIEPDRRTVSINGSPFHCHGYIAELDAWVVLGLDPAQNPQMSRPGAKLSVRAEWAVKRTLFQAFCDKPLIWLDNYDEGRRLWGALAGSSVSGPGFDYQVAGDQAGAPLLDAFFASASFIENLGLDVASAIAAMDADALGPDRLFFQALAHFWPAFNQALRQQTPPIMTYNTLFALLGEGAPQHLERLPDALIAPMTHVLVDEFQDISPQIVSWLRASLAEARRRARVAQPSQAAQTSLLCVGDDWQSIYGWRGSSTHYFLAFEQEFPASSTTRVLLSDNYRSQQMIIDAAEHLVRPVRSLPGKKASAAGVHLPPATAVQVLGRDGQHLSQRLREHHRQGHSVLILFRGVSDKSLIDNEVNEIILADGQRPIEQRQIRLMSVHSAKGLQADAVFLLGDCTYAASSPYRNEVYRLAGLAGTGQVDGYDAAQRDEVLRLAYVGITRAVGHCYWYVPPPTRREQAGVTAASARVPNDTVFFTDLRSQGDAFS
ncbi:UvrD-helicase domain-containing protein [Pseudomonas sp. dw_358]|uniref:UvrD-helicase domain-containing protein n=1 Tax=Pseudomonas sp. dw_358 TaxID=2720083 RepID=UPI001BD4CE92|nr:UvrD-helicase domain-containing protein [Pseudomonas sp. dw_358]